jgi:uncharacterized protein YndB with AHSA1/START domain
VIVNVCPAAVTSAPPERVWSVLTDLDKLEDWVDARLISGEPRGAMEPGQTINLVAPSLGREWPVKIQVRDLDPQHRWIDLLVELPFGVENHEHVTLTPAKEGGTLVRLN